ncbi:hypothetical protein [Spongiivirga citrea]|uniref:Outer membrane beta-barrel protein n=1 Tax=Spongiivirga citrea TaxID=1481457 RepID=A0A6M0CMZ1_9FLAO|nr:hypothetical protein [Spongiivirga citrea]NER18313.1 hypothetical protein [Spongiivirga citrea]
MEKKKDLGSIFKQHLSALDKSPSEFVWKNILKEKKRKKRRFFFLLFSGITAVIIMMSFIGIQLNQKDAEYELPTINTVTTKDDNCIDAIPESEDKIVNIEDVTDNANSVAPTKDIDIRTIKTKQDDAGLNQKNTIPVPNSSTRQSPFKSNKKKITQTLNNTINSDTDNISKDASEATYINSPSTEQSIHKTNSITNDNEPHENGINKIVEQDSLQQETELPIKKIKSELEPKKKEEEEIKRPFRIFVHASPTYYNAFSNYSIIDQSLDENTKNGGISLSYGVYLTYQLSNKTSLRLGVNMLNAVYNTNQVISNSPNTLLNYSFIDYASQIPSAQLNTIFENNTKITLKQTIKSVEIPIEMSNKIYFNNRFKVNIISGISLSRLTDSSVAVIQNDLPSILLGQTTQYPRVFFTVNVGIGLQYGLTKNIRFQAEPIFKYQMNSLNNRPRNFNPYFIGIQSGISFIIK